MNFSVSFDVAIGDLRSSLQLVNDRCCRLRENSSAVNFAYQTSMLVSMYTLQLDTALQWIERMGLEVLELKDYIAINAVAKELEEVLLACLHTLDSIKVDKYPEPEFLGFRFRGKVERRDDLLPLAHKLHSLEVTLLCRVEIIKRRPVESHSAREWLAHGRRTLPEYHWTISKDLFTWPRICVLIMLMFAIFIALSCFLGVYFTVERSYGYSMGDAFTLSGWVIAVKHVQWQGL